MTRSDFTREPDPKLRRLLRREIIHFLLRHHLVAIVDRETFLLRFLVFDHLKELLLLCRGRLSKALLHNLVCLGSSALSLLPFLPVAAIAIHNAAASDLLIVRFNFNVSDVDRGGMPKRLQEKGKRKPEK